MIVKNPNKFKKRLFFCLIIFGLVLLFVPNVTFGLGGSLEDQLYAKNISGLIRMISHLVYVFIWPCLVIAGTALDNSLIYGSFLHLDAALWNIWNIMKNFANFALGFVFVFTIVTNLFKGVVSKADPMKNAVGTIKSTLLAGVLVQMSWFLVAALIDLSTILIYAVGGLPLSTLGLYNKKASEVPIMKMNTEIGTEDTYYYYSYGDYNFSPCFLINKEGDVDENVRLNGADWEYIAGRKRLYLSDGVEFKSGYCTLNGYLYKYKESDWLTCGQPQGCFDSTIGNTLAEKNSGYYHQLRDYLTSSGVDTGWVQEQKEACFLINAYGIDYKDDCTPLCSGYGAVPYTGDLYAEVKDGLTLEELLNKSKGWVGPFVTMYSSILNYQELVMDPGNDSTMGTLFGFLINTFFALILFLPMAILAILLVVRVGYLWVVVAISPILVLAYSFMKTDGDSPLKKLADNFGKTFSIKNVLMQIFSPVIVVFAVSLCIVFLSVIYKSEPEEDKASDTLSAFGIECVDQNSGSGGDSCDVTNKKCSYSVLGLVTINMNAQNYNHGKNMFVWVLMEFLATGIVWFFLKFAIKLVGKFSEKNLGENLMKTAEKYVTTLPVLQLPGVKGKVGLQALGIGEGNENEFVSNLKSKISNLETAQDTAIKNRFSSGSSDGSGGSEVSLADAISYIRSNPNITYEKLDPKYREALVSAGYKEDILGIVRDEKYKDLVAAGQSLTQPTSSAGTNADAVKFTNAQLDVAVKAETKWKNWAAGVVGGSVQLQNGVFMVDYVGGKVPSNVSNAQYEIVSRKVYEERHFGNNTIENVTKDYYNQHEQIIQDYLKQLQEELDDLKKIEEIDPSKRTDTQNNQYNSLKQLGITQDQLDQIKKKLEIN